VFLWHKIKKKICSKSGNILLLKLYVFIIHFNIFHLYSHHKKYFSSLIYRIFSQNNICVQHHIYPKIYTLLFSSYRLLSVHIRINYKTGTSVGGFLQAYPAQSMVWNVPLLSLHEHKCHVSNTWITAWCLHANIIHTIACCSSVFPTVTLQQNYKDRWNQNKQTEVIITANG